MFLLFIYSSAEDYKSQKHNGIVMDIRTKATKWISMKIYFHFHAFLHIYSFQTDATDTTYDVIASKWFQWHMDNILFSFSSITRTAFILNRQMDIAYRIFLFKAFPFSFSLAYRLSSCCFVSYLIKWGIFLQNKKELTCEESRA